MRERIDQIPDVFVGIECAAVVGAVLHVIPPLEGCSINDALIAQVAVPEVVSVSIQQRVVEVEDGEGQGGSGALFEGWRWSRPCRIAASDWNDSSCGPG